jgi:outer membrane receptor protein involved in Fe transport
VSVYVDGVYLASGAASLRTLNNIAQVDVLKGPQGTLFGRNATGGLINITTRDPQSTFGGEANLGYGNYQTAVVGGYLTGPLSEQLTADLALRVSTQGQGYGTNLFNGEDAYRTVRDLAVRSKWRWTPGSSTSLSLIFDYEELDAYEIGLKTEFLDHRIRWNTAAYYYDYKNIQVGHFVLGQIGYYNGAAAKIYGLDSDFEALITRGLTITAGVSLIHDRFTNFPNAVIFTPQPFGGNAITNGSANGNHLPLAPDATFNASIDYRHSLPVGELRLNISDSYSTGYVFAPDNILRQPSYNLVNSAISWIAPDDRFTASVWGKNLSNEIVANALLSSAIGSLATYQAPRTFGVSVTVKF